MSAFVIYHDLPARRMVGGLSMPESKGVAVENGIVSKKVGQNATKGKDGEMSPERRTDQLSWK
jgi:hypothetical protein